VPEETGEISTKSIHYKDFIFKAILGVQYPPNICQQAQGWGKKEEAASPGKSVSSFSGFPPCLARVYS
jgi:hypothetical protein